MHLRRHLPTVLARSLAAALTATAGLAWAAGPHEGTPRTISNPVHDALSDDPARAEPARQPLRASGPAGLAQLEAAHPDLLHTLREAPRDLFKPFVRTPERDTSASPGVGLGLALARRMARATGGELRTVPVTAQAPGARFDLSLPRISRDNRSVRE